MKKIRLQDIKIKAAYRAEVSLNRTMKRRLKSPELEGKILARFRKAVWGDHHNRIVLKQGSKNGGREWRMRVKIHPKYDRWLFGQLRALGRGNDREILFGGEPLERIS